MRKRNGLLRRRVLTAERRFNVLFFDNWREAPLLAPDRQMSVGSIFSSALVANGLVYFGSTEGFIYALNRRPVRLQRIEIAQPTSRAL